MSININHVENARQQAVLRERANGSGGGKNYEKGRKARRPRSEWKNEEREHRQYEALQRAQSGETMTNYPAIFAGFSAKGITDIRPRENVFTFHAWKAKGQSVKKGEHGVKIVTFVPIKTDETGPDGEAVTYSRPHTTTVFHISQTEDETERQVRLMEAKRSRPVSLEATF